MAKGFSFAPAISSLHTHNSKIQKKRMANVLMDTKEEIKEMDGKKQNNKRQNILYKLLVT